MTINRKRWCLDSNAVAQEKGIEAVLAVVQYSGESSAKYAVSFHLGLTDRAIKDTNRCASWPR